jgi:hypothetical protein
VDFVTTAEAYFGYLKRNPVQTHISMVKTNSCKICCFSYPELWFVCLLQCVPQGRVYLRIILAQYYKSYNNNSFHTNRAPARFEPESTRDPTATHHLDLPGPGYKDSSSQPARPIVRSRFDTWAVVCFSLEGDLPKQKLSRNPRFKERISFVPVRFGQRPLTTRRLQVWSLHCTGTNDFYGISH